MSVGLHSRSAVGVLAKPDPIVPMFHCSFSILIAACAVGARASGYFGTQNCGKYCTKSSCAASACNLSRLRFNGSRSACSAIQRLNATNAAGLGDPKAFGLVAEFDRVWVVTGLLAANDVHLKTVFVDGGVFLTPAHTKTSVHLFEHAQHGTVHARELGGEHDALAGVPPQIDVAGGQGMGVHLVKRGSAKTEAAIHRAYWGKPGWPELMTLSCRVDANGGYVKSASSVAVK